MRTLERLPAPLEPLTLSPVRRAALARYIEDELTAAQSTRQGLENQWAANLTRYEAQPSSKRRDIPFVGASTQTIPLVATACDSIYAQIFSIITNTSPVLTVAATSAQYVAHAKTIQRRIENGIDSGRWNFLPAFNHATKDTCKQGTGVYFTQWYETRIKGRRTRTLRAGPRIKPIPIENVYVPMGSYDDIQELPWIAIAQEMTDAELHARAKLLQWDVSAVHTGSFTHRIRALRELLTDQTGDLQRGDHYRTIYRWWGYYDVDNDDEQEDLYAVYNLESGSLLAYEYNTYDSRPFDVSHFDINEYLFYGKGIAAILAQLQDISSDAIRHWLDNAFLANTRMYAGPPDACDSDTITVWAGRFFKSMHPDQIRELKVSDIYPSLPLLLNFVLSLAERRTGINDLTQPRPSQVLGSRTPGITAISLLNQANLRHASAFDSVRNATAGAIKQCLYREQERLLLGDTRLREHLARLLGPADAALYITALADPDFDDAVTIELTASSTTINRETERQNALLLTNLYRQYAGDIMQLVMALTNAQMPQPVRDVAQQLITKGGELFERTMRTFDHVRDPEAFVLRVDTELAQLDQQVQDPLGQMLAMATGGMQPGTNGSAGGGQTLGVEHPTPGDV